jgi:hypothetical protein
VTAQYEDHFAMFVDLLGFAEAVESVDDSRRQAVLQMLRSMAANRSNFQYTREETSPRSYRTQMVPSVSTFSDHILISYPLSGIPDQGPWNLTFNPLLLCAQIAAELAREAMAIGFLIRGAATIAPLYHADGVVFGEALVEAYRLETRTAFYPRIVLSDKITRHPEMTKRRPPFVAIDSDGLAYLDYFGLMLMGMHTGSSKLNVPEQRAWFDAASTTIKANIDAL